MNRSLKMLAKLSVGMMMVLGAGAVNATSIEVQVGYADNIRPSPFFPSPWDGDSNVQVFAGGGGSYDAGAIRVINTGATDLIFGGLTVDGFGDGSSYSIWNSYIGATISAGKSIIFTQTAAYNFDSSDNQGGGPSTAIPVVHFILDGTAFDFADTAQVLNTEGTDALAQANLNESHQWRDIGTYGGQAAIPEPGVIALLGLGFAGMAGLRRQKTSIG